MNIGMKCLAVHSSKFITVHVTFVTKELQAPLSLKRMLSDINIECHPELLGTT